MIFLVEDSSVNLACCLGDENKCESMDALVGASWDTMIYVYRLMTVELKIIIIIIIITKKKENLIKKG